jgi:hypothetical protein
MAKKGRGKVERPAETRKRNFELSLDTDMSLSVMAMREGLTRSALAERILSGALRDIVITFDGVQ